MEMMEKIFTHQQISRALCGEPVEIGNGFSRVTLKTLPEMSVDAMGLVHGGFVFGAADYAAMVAVNDPHVVLGAAEVKFLKPVKAGDELSVHARVISGQGKKKTVTVSVEDSGERVFEGVFTCFVLDAHVLDRSRFDS
jgi:uncharacterized protein (TIGR00369 family)